MRTMDPFTNIKDENESLQANILQKNSYIALYRKEEQKIESLNG